MAESKAWRCTNNKRKNKGKPYFIVPMPSNFECRDIGQQCLHNIGTGYTLKTSSFGSNVLGILALISISEHRGSLPTQMLPTSVRVLVDLLSSIVVFTVIE